MIGITLCKSVLEHIESPIKAILEMKRITNYKIIIVVPNVINIRRILLNLKSPIRRVNAETKHLQGWDIKLMNHIANATGLKVIAVEWRSENPHRWGYVFMPLFASHMIAVLKDGGEVCARAHGGKIRGFASGSNTDYKY